MNNNTRGNRPQSNSGLNNQSSNRRTGQSSGSRPAQSSGGRLSYRGSSAKSSGGRSSYKGSSTHKTNHVEGVAAIVPTKGTFDSILNKLLEGLRSGCSYQGAHNLQELRDNPEFVRITNAGLIESHPHNIMG